MNRLGCFCLCAFFALSLTATVCSSSNSGSASGWDKARVGNTGVGWWVNAAKSAYYFEAKISPSAPEDAAGRAAVITFAQKVVSGVTSSTADPATLVPTADETSGWTLDQGYPKTAGGVATATDSVSATALVDGAADPFYDPSKSYKAKGLAWEVYDYGNYLVDLKVWQMASPSDASVVYDDLQKDDPLYNNVTWTACTGPATGADPCPAQ